MFVGLIRVSTVVCLSLLVTSFASPGASGEERPGSLSSAEWANVEAVHQAKLHAVSGTERGFSARNAGQEWQTDFDCRGFLIEPQSNAWTWGLELWSYGFAGEEDLVGTAACASAEGGRVTYAWDDLLDEWYLNDTRGLEHGFTVHQRPRCAVKAKRGPLALNLRVRGTLSPVVQADGRSVHLVDERERVVLTYSGLTAFDADGKTLHAWFEANEGELRFNVDESGARYPLTIDPIAQQAYLKSSNPGALDQFGQAVAISGDTLVVGAPFESSNATGVNGNQNNDGAFRSGAAYVFVRDGSDWVQQAYLKASNTGAQDDFGFSVAISGDTIAVGAKWESSTSNVINGNQFDDSGFATGAVYVFVRSGTTWSQQAYLKAGNAEPGDTFGESVAIDGNSIVVGAVFEASNATGVDGAGGNNSVFGSGAAYVFARSGTNWSQQAYLKASNTGTSDLFGWSCSISGSTLVIGARDEGSAATGINGSQFNNLAPSSGAAYVFARSGTTWAQQAYLKASNTGAGDLFGISVAISGSSLVVGACEEGSDSTGVDGDQLNDGMPGSGAAYAFVRSGSTWTQQAYFKPSNTGSGDLFGWSVDLSGGNLVVGARGEGSTATSSVGDQSNDDAAFAGAAYSFVRSGSAWVQQDYIKAFNAEFSDQFGQDVAIHGETIVVGAIGESSSAAGVNGDETNNDLANSGAAYAFGLNGFFVSYCSGNGGNQMGCTSCPCGNNASTFAVGGCLNSAGGSARLEASGDPSVSLPAMSANDLRFGIFGAPPNAFCILNSGDGLAPGNMANPCFGMNSGSQAAAFDGLRCAIMNTRRHGGRSANSSGTVGVTNNPWGGEGGPPVGIAIAGGGFASGQTRYFQVINRDEPLAVCMRGLNTSQAIGVTFEP